MWLVEFNGLPGCGKSTVSEALILMLREKEIECVTYDVVHEKMPEGTVRKIIYALCNWNFKETFQLYCISKCVNGSSFITQLRRVAIAEQICVNYRKFAIGKSICVIDQGLIQAIASILHTFEINNKGKIIKLTKEIISKYKNLLAVVNSDSTVITAKTRIRFRNFDHGSRMNYIRDDSELLELLEKQMNNVELIRRSINGIGIRHIDIDMCNESDSNAEELMRWIISNVSAKKINK